MGISKLIKSAIMAIVAVLAVSCSGVVQPSADEVAAKISNGEQLEAADYDTMLDYLDEFCELGEMSSGSYEEGQEAAKEYPHFMVFALSMDKAPAEVKSQPRFKDIQTRFLILMSN